MYDFPDKVFLNGAILATSEAKVSVFDRGFLFGDGVYEVMTCYRGQIFCKETHFQRLYESLKKINLSFAMDGIHEPLDDLLQACDLDDKDCMIYLQITRGVAPRKHAFPKNTMPTLMMYALPFSGLEVNQTPMHVVQLPDYRWHRCDIKMTSLLGNVMSHANAKEQNAHEAILVRNGVVTEASHSNVFFVRDDLLYTHPANELILNGITRQVVIRLCKELKLKVREEAVGKAEALQMDEAFLTGTTTRIASIKQMDAHLFYQGDEAGTVTKALQEAFLNFQFDSSRVK
ncbi:MAG: aminotransferase class IV [Bacteroidota bacterium]